MIKISACVIVKNEEKNMKQWINSISKIASEMIVVDTGSSDQTKNIAEAGGATIYTYGWKQDFAAAKNFAISKATGDWVLFLDADEYFSEETIENVWPYLCKIHINRRIDAIIAPRLELNADEGYRYMGTSQVVRIFRRDIKILYEGKIHETLVRKGGILRLASPDRDIEICHTGYSSTLIKSKLERNLEILQQEVREMGEQRRHYIYFLDCYYGLEQYEKAIEYAKKCIEQKVAPLGQESMIYRRWIDALVFSLAKENEILQVISLAIEKYPELPEFYWNKGKILYDQKNYSEAEKALKITLELYQRKHFKGESGTFETKVSFFYYLYGKILEKKGDQEGATNFFAESLKSDRYHRDALEALYQSIRSCDPVDIIDFLQQFYKNTKEKDIEFVESVLKKYPLDKVYLYYADILQKKFKKVIEDLSFSGFIAAEKPEEAILYAKEQASAAYNSLMIGALLNGEEAEKKAKEILPDTYQNVLLALKDLNRNNLSETEILLYDKVKTEMENLRILKHVEEKSIEKITTIIVVCMDQLVETKQCIEAIREYTKMEEIELLLVANAPGKEMSSWLEQQTDIHWIVNEKNEGFIKAANRGMQAAKTKEILLMHNDVIVTKAWLEHLRSTLYSALNIGAVAPVALGAHNRLQCPENHIEYHTIDELQHMAETLYCDMISKKAWRESLFLQHFCLLLKKEVVDKIGVMDERFSPAFFADYDYSFRILKSGYRLLAASNILIHHTGSISFSDLEERKMLALKNFERFKEKWRFNPLYSSNIREDLLQYIQVQQKDLQVLDIGCACGGNLMRIKELYPDAEVYGIELDRYAAEIASCFGEVCRDNIETMEKPEWEGKFHYIILGDILEHLQEPKLALKKIWKMLQQGGFIVTSIPNVMHISVIGDLLQGYWHYEEAGILDRTHLRFFTKFEVQELMVQSGFSIQEIGYTTTEITANQQELKQYLLKWKETLQAEEEFDAYQWVVCAVKEIRNDDDKKVLSKKWEQRCIILLKELTEEKLHDEQGLLDLITGDGEYIEPLLDLIKEAFPNSVKASIDTMVFLYQNGYQMEAIQMARSAFLRDNKDTDLTYAYAFLLHLQGNDQEASEVLIKAADFSEDLLRLAKDVEQALLGKDV